MNNATGDETTGTTYVTPYRVKAYQHLGEKGGKWKTKISLLQIGEPVETAAA